MYRKTKIVDCLSLFLTVFLQVLFLCSLSRSVYGLEKLEFGPENTKLEGSISYSLIGKYKAVFSTFNGEIDFDNNSRKIKSVILRIETKSIQSAFSTLDKIVRSKQILDVEQFPEIVFKSNNIVKAEHGYLVQGILSMHGVEKEATFPFEFEAVGSPEDVHQVIKASGSWVIDRKEFNVVWSKLLDKGGVIVGNNITIDWEIEIKQSEENNV